MENYNLFKKNRTIKQFLIALTFPIIVIGGWRYPLLGYFIPICMILGIGVGLWRGRKWCDWYCPRGSFFDTIVKYISPKKEIPKFFKGLPLRIGFLSFLMAMMIIQIIKRWPDPYKIGMFFVVLLSVTTILGLILAFVYHQRSWCCFCPIGSLGNWIGKGRYPLKIDSKLCTECKLCYKICPIQISPYSFKKENIEIVKDGDCLKCALCVSACPKKALNFKEVRK